MAAVAGLRGTGDWGVDERPKNFREMILFRNPNGTAPIFALMAKVRKESTDDPEFAWWDEPNDIVRLQTTAEVLASGTTIVVDSGDPDTSNPKANWGLATHLKPGDLLLVEPIGAETAAFNHEIVEVVSVTSPTEFDVVRGAAGTTAATIPADSFLLLVGSSYAEGTRAPIAATRNPQKYFNYTQIFKDTYDITGTAEQTHLRTGDPVKNDKKRKAFDHARAIELALLYGSKSETVGSNGKPKRTMDGIRKFIPAANTTVFTAASDLNDFIDAASVVFDFDSPAGDTRIAFCGNSALNNLNKALANASGQAALNINFQGGTKVYGMNFMEMRMPQGTILIKTHPLLSRNSLFTNSMVIVDFSAIRWRPLRNRDTKFKDNVQENDEDTRRGLWITEGGVEVDFGGLTCGYIAGMQNLAPA